MLGGCARETADPEPRPAGRLTISAERRFTGPWGTKAAVEEGCTLWTKDDCMGVFTSGHPDGNAPFVFTGEERSATGRFDGVLEAADGETVYAYYPYREDNADAASVRFDFAGQVQRGFGPSARDHLGAYAFMAARPGNVHGGEAALTMDNLAVQMRFSFSLPTEAELRWLTMRVASNKLYEQAVADIRPAEGARLTGTGTAAAGVTLGFENGALKASEEATAYMMMMPADLSADAVTFYLSGTAPDGSPVAFTARREHGLRFESGTVYTAELGLLEELETKPDVVFVPGGSMDVCNIPDDQIGRGWKLNGFWMGRTEVTNAQYCEFLNAKGISDMDYRITAWLNFYSSSFGGGDAKIEYAEGGWRPKTGSILRADGSKTAGPLDDYPINGVTYNGAAAYANWLNESAAPEGMSWSLPTEAQWEYAAVGSAWNPDYGQNYAGSDRMEEVGWYGGNCESEGSSCMGKHQMMSDGQLIVGGSAGGTHPVARLKPNWLGIYDMTGNVWEWCYGWYGEQWPYDPHGPIDPQGPGSSSDYYRPIRGGSWFGWEIPVWYRDMNTGDMYYNFLGFRVALNAVTEETE